MHEGHVMVKIEWDDSLSVGIHLIDEQHKMLIQRLQALVHAIETYQSVNEIVKTLDFLIEYTNFHFSTEEKHMTETKYPGLTSHRAHHEEFKATLQSLTVDFEEDGATRALAESVNVFLMNWLVKHIKAVDLLFGTFLMEKRLSLSE
jgi:hemerythrin